MISFARNRGALWAFDKIAVLMMALVLVFMLVMIVLGWQTSDGSGEYFSCRLSMKHSPESEQHCADVTGHTPKPRWVNGTKIQIKPRKGN